RPSHGAVKGMYGTGTLVTLSDILPVIDRLYRSDVHFLTCDSPLCSLRHSRGALRFFRGEVRPTIIATSSYFRSDGCASRYSSTSMISFCTLTRDPSITCFSYTGSYSKSAIEEEGF